MYHYSKYIALSSLSSFLIDFIVIKPLIASQKLKPTSDKKIGITGLPYIYKIIIK